MKSIPYKIAFFFYHAIIRPVLNLFILIVSVILILVCCLISRYRSQKAFDIGLGPDPLINNFYHKKALELFGYKAHTFVTHTFYQTQEFDFISFRDLNRFIHLWWGNYYVFMLSVWRYKCIYIYFNGGALYPTALWRWEPLLYKLARVKVVVLAYGGDVQDMSRSRSLVFKHVHAMDYPRHKLNRKRTSEQIDLWTKYASHVLGGCEWVDYMHGWDTLLLAHFTIDTEMWKPLNTDGEKNDKTFKIFHAPNHKNIKGTRFFVDAVDELKKEGYDVELMIVQGVPNNKMKEKIMEADIIADQLIVGWYAMFAIEAMSMCKPVICYLREDLENLYITAGLIKKDEIPIINCDCLSVKEKIKSLMENRDSLKDIGLRSREYVKKHHSIEYIGSVFDKINKKIGVRNN